MKNAGEKALARPLHESLVVRLLADGMANNSVLHRVFGDQLEAKSFPEADTIVWIVRAGATVLFSLLFAVRKGGSYPALMLCAGRSVQPAPVTD